MVLQTGLHPESWRTTYRDRLCWSLQVPLGPGSLCPVFPPPTATSAPSLLGWPRLILHPASHCENDDTNNEESNTASALLSTPILGGEALRCGANPALSGFRNLSAVKPWQHEPASPPRMKRDELTEKLLAEYGHIISVIHHPNPSRRGSLTPLL